MKSKTTNILAGVLGAVMLGLLLFYAPSYHTTTKTSSVISNLTLTQQTKAEYSNSQVYTFDSRYTTANTQWLIADYYKEFRKELSRNNIVSWNNSFDCDHFARYYTSYLQTKYLGENFMDKSAPQSVAVGVVCYYVSGDKSKGHAINCAIDDSGKIILIEPQGGEIVKLSDKEKASVFLVLW